MAINYALVMFGFGLGAVISSTIAGHYKNIATDNIDLMFPAFIIASACATFAIVLIVIIKYMKKVKTS